MIIILLTAIGIPTIIFYYCLFKINKIDFNIEEGWEEEYGGQDGEKNSTL